MASPWPGTLEKLRDAGYSYQERGNCLSRSCTTEVFWFITPNQKWMPFEILPPAEGSDQALYQPHFGTCPDSRKFSRKAKAATRA